MTQYVAVAEQSEEDKKWMREALEMAKEAFEAAEVPVGSVFVRNGEVIAKARNRTNELMNVSLDTTTLDFVQSAYISSPLE
jgi:tRNA-specific adenosine deaminase 2